MIGCPVTIIKRNANKVETWRYSGTVLHQNDQKITIEALFDRPDTSFHEIIIKEGDRFVETYFNDRWYNILAIYDREDGMLKGWYCNISYPAEISGGVVSYIDLALDLFVYADGRQLELDYDEYEALQLPAPTREKAEEAFKELKDLFERVFNVRSIY